VSDTWQAGEVIEYRKVTSNDRDTLRAFADGLPRRDHSFVDPFLLHEVAVASWTMATTARRIAAFDGDRAVGLLTVVPHTGWASHVGDLRSVVLPERRGEGIGRELVDRGLVLADEMGVEKVMVEIRSSNTGALAMFAALGFTTEARYAGHVRDPDGNVDDLLVVVRWTARPAAV
jgi:ribosomal protein S18 acetylase RimI-like enzyme